MPSDVLASDTFATGLAPFWEDVREGEVTGGVLRLACVPEYGTAETLRLFPIADTTYTVELLTRPDLGAGTTQAIHEVAIDSENKLATYVQADVINFQEIVAGESEETTIEFDPVAHRWQRHRLDGNVVYWETSPDGEAWTTRRTKEAAIDPGQIAQGRLLCGFYGSESELSPAYAEFDNFSIFGPLFAPIAVTGPVGAAPLTRSAPMTGTVNPRLSPTSYYFEYGLTTDYGRRAPSVAVELGAGNDPVPVSEHARGLSPGTTYHYRLVAESEGGTDYGEDATFTTSLGVRVGDAVIDPVVRSVVFDGHAIADFHEVHQRTEPPAITEVPDPLGADRTVLKMTVRNDDVAPLTPTENPRAQGLTDDLIRPGDQCRLFGETLFPDDFPASLPTVGEDGGWLSFADFYGPPFAGSSPWSLGVNGEDKARLTWQRNGTYGYDIPFQIDLDRGVWIPWIAEFLFARKGWVRMWINGVPVVLFDPATSYNPNDEEPTEKLFMATRDSSNDGEPGNHNNHAKILNYRLHNMFMDPITIYHAGLSLERLVPVAVRI